MDIKELQKYGKSGSDGNATHWLLPALLHSSYAAYREAAGGGAVESARAMAPDEIIEVVHRSRLRGRGGAGFPAGVKWRSIAKHPCPTRYVVCNAADGEPGTFKDRTLLRRNPYAVLEGIPIKSAGCHVPNGL